MTTTATGSTLAGTTFGSCLRQLAEDDPGRPALTCGDRTLDRASVVRQVQRLAARLASLGVGAGDAVTIGLPNSAEFVLAMFATWELGAVPQPISHRLPAGERNAIIDLAAPAAVVGIHGSEGQGRPTLSVDDVRVALEDGSTGDLDAPSTAISPSWKAVPSGGSTGRPKLIVAEQPATFEAVSGFGALLRFPADGCVLVTGPLSHNAPFTVAGLGLLFGDHIVVMERFDAAEALRLVERHRVDWVYLVPTMMLRIWRLPQEERTSFDLSSLDVVFHMAAPCAPWLKREWIDWMGGEKILELYAGTEMQAATVIDGIEWTAHEGSVGRTVVGEMQVRGQDGSILRPGEVGEIWMRRGPGEPVPYRYVGASPKAAEEGWESLGDFGSMDADGYLYLTDRETDMIVVGGSNVYPAEVEGAIDEHPAVRSSCVIGLPDDDLGNVPHGIVQLVEHVSDDELRAFLRERLAPYKVPRTFERTDEPLRDDAGKVRRSALRAERLAGSSPGSA